MNNNRIFTWINKNKPREYRQNTILITGGNSGLGLAFTKMAVLLGDNVIVTVRSQEKGEATIRELDKVGTNKNFSYMVLDLSSRKSIDTFVKNFHENNLDITYLYHNAGVFRQPYQLTEDGYELSLGTNFLGTYYLTEKLIPIFQNYSHPVHINFTTSATAFLYHLDYRQFMPKDEVGKMRSYARSKLCLIHLYEYYLKKYKGSNLFFSLSHPGSSYTPLITKGYKFKFMIPLIKGFMKLVFHTPEKASLTYLYLLFKEVQPNQIVGPRGLLQLSGYPKTRTLKKKYYKGYQKTMKMANEILEL